MRKWYAVKLDTPSHKVPPMGFAVVFVTDSWAPGLSSPSEPRHRRRRQARNPRNNSSLPLESDPELDPDLVPGPERGPKFYLALACYGAIALLAALTLDGKFRLVVWIFLGGLALKTYIATLKQP